VVGHFDLQKPSWPWKDTPIEPREPPDVLSELIHRLRGNLFLAALLLGSLFIRYIYLRNGSLSDLSATLVFFGFCVPLWVTA
jgi:hypothetical protein